MDCTESPDEEDDTKTCDKVDCCCSEVSSVDDLDDGQCRGPGLQFSPPLNLDDMRVHPEALVFAERRKWYISLPLHPLHYILSV